MGGERPGGGLAPLPGGGCWSLRRGKVRIAHRPSELLPGFHPDFHLPSPQVLAFSTFDISLDLSFKIIAGVKGNICYGTFCAQQCYPGTVLAMKSMSGLYNRDEIFQTFGWIRDCSDSLGADPSMTLCSFRAQFFDWS